MKVFEIQVSLYEGGPVSLGFFSTHEKAFQAEDEAREEWDGPNVEDISIVEHEVA